MTCTASGTTVSGLYANVARAEAPEPCGGVVSDTDASHYNTPVLEFATTQNYRFIWNDAGSGADRDGGFWRPLPAVGYFFLGDYGQGNYGGPTQSVYTVRVREYDNSASPALAPPAGYAQVWNGLGFFSSVNGSIWAPVPQPGYVCPGHLAVVGFSGPDSSNSPGLGAYRCVRSDLVMPIDLGGLIWSDQGSTIFASVAVYRIPRLNVIYAIPNYAPPTQRAFIPVGLP
jgi:hypothetical protein